MNDNDRFYIAAQGKQPKKDQAWTAYLWQIKNMARLYREPIALFDSEGFRKGTVYPDGSVVE